MAYRSSAAYKLILTNWQPPQAPARPALNVTYLTFTSEVNLPMLRESIASLARSWSRFPKLRVVGDGTVSPEMLRRTLKFWPAELEALDWCDLVNKVQLAGYEAMTRFAMRVPMARKMVAIVASALDGPTMYADTDVLWFQLPQFLLNEDVSRKPRIIMSPDLQPSYDTSLVQNVLPHLLKPPYFCAGTLFANGDFVGACKIEHLLDYAAEHGVLLTEQTIFAEMNRKLGSETLDESKFALIDSDRFSLAPSFIGKPWVARHYIGQVRHLFWRDALALRIGIG